MTETRVSAPNYLLANNSLIEAEVESLNHYDMANAASSLAGDNLSSWIKRGTDDDHIRRLLGSNIKLTLQLNKAGRRLDYLDHRFKLLYLAAMMDYWQLGESDVRTDSQQ